MKKTRNHLSESPGPSVDKDEGIRVRERTEEGGGTGIFTRSDRPQKDLSVGSGPFPRKRFPYGPGYVDRRFHLYGS